MWRVCLDLFKKKKNSTVNEIDSTVISEMCTVCILFTAMELMRMWVYVCVGFVYMVKVTHD